MSRDTINSYMMSRQQNRGSASSHGTCIRARNTDLCPGQKVCLFCDSIQQLCFVPILRIHRCKHIFQRFLVDALKWYAVNFSESRLERWMHHYHIMKCIPRAVLKLPGCEQRSARHSQHEMDQLCRETIGISCYKILNLCRLKINTADRRQRRLTSTSKLFLLERVGVCENSVICAEVWRRDFDITPDPSLSPFSSSFLFFVIIFFSTA